MNPDTLKALNRSIKHWWNNTFSKIEGITSSDCALCNLHFRQPGKRICQDCPVAIFSGDTHCDRTPYTAAANSWQKLDESLSDESDDTEFRAAAELEWKFLVSLLPPEEHWTPYNGPVPLPTPSLQYNDLVKNFDAALSSDPSWLAAYRQVILKMSSEPLLDLYA